MVTGFFLLLLMMTAVDQEILRSEDFQKKDTNNRPSETRNKRKTRNKIINKTSYFLINSLNKSLNQK